MISYLLLACVFMDALICRHHCIFNELLYNKKVLWLKVSTTNSDSKVVARYYLEAVENAKGAVYNILINKNTRW